MENENLTAEIAAKLARRRNDKYVMGRKGGGHGFILAYLSSHDGGAFPGEICREMGVSSARVAVLLRDLEAHGFITRTALSGDRRKVRVSLTEAGWRKAADKKRQLETYTRRLLERLTPEDARALSRILDAMEALQSEQTDRLEPQEPAADRLR